jgi:predicted RecB family nuclease
VALVAGVDKGLAIALRDIGVATYDELLTKFDEAALAAFSRPWGKGTQRVGTKAGSILRMARALATQSEMLLGAPAIPPSQNYVMFDLEGLPPQLDELEKVYLWGLRVYGEDPGKFRAATAGFGQHGDREGWEAFLKEAGAIFARYGDIPFIHWHHYERVRLDMYIEHHGDQNGVAARVRANLLDLLPIAQQSIALPLPSYSLKVFEKYLGFRRTQDEYGGNWAMAKYIEATETGDDAQRKGVMDQILLYNKEDLQATWAVLRWLQAKGA